MARVVRSSGKLKFNNCHTNSVVQRQMKAENTASDKPNIPVVGLSSCGHSVISLLSASVLISTQLPPINTQHTTKFYTYRQMLYKHNAVKHTYYWNVHNS